ncbi:MAG: hypothetical protein JHD10_08565 [Sphingomonadaceae bacterium]|nr:hypothetical protein [Sphingomonadaceae bacterium]
MNEDQRKPRKTLPSAFDRPDISFPSTSQIVSVEAAAAELGITKAVRVPTIGEQKTTYSVRTTKDVQKRLQEFAYIERLTIGDAIEKLLNIAEERRG